MMVHLLVIAHAPLASALCEVARHVYPDCAGSLQGLDVEGSLSAEQVQSAAQAIVNRWPNDEVLILTDAFGATPCNAALAVADGQRVRVVAGVNVPMLWRSLCYRNESLESLVSRAVAGATQGVMQVSAPRRQNQLASVPTEHDQVQHSHQQ